MPGIRSNGSLEIPEPLVLEKYRDETIQGGGEGGSTFPSFFFFSCPKRKLVRNTFSAYSVSATVLEYRCLKELIFTLQFMSITRATIIKASAKSGGCNFQVLMATCLQGKGTGLQYKLKTFLQSLAVRECAV